MTQSTTTRIDDRALSRLTDRIKFDVEAGDYDGAVIAIAHKGEIVAHEAIGYAERDTGRRAHTDDIFRILSLTKAFTNTLVYQAIELGLLSMTTKVVDVIPEFRSKDRFLNKRKDRISVTDLITHRSALPPTPEPVEYERLGSLEATIEAICSMDAIGDPGHTVDYSPAFNHALLGEMVRRVHGNSLSFGELLQRDVFEPLGMTNTALGAPEAWADRLVPLKARFEATGWLSAADIEILNTVLDEKAEMPWVGAVSSAGDVLRFAEMLRRGGELNGVRLIAPAILERATKNHTGTLINNWWIPMAQRRNWDVMPANLGLGFFIRGEGMHPSILGTLTSPGTFGNYGAGSTLYWVDPARELSLVCLTSGVMEESANIERFQRLSDMTVSTVVNDSVYPDMK
ncbi:serine hydrolase domain-containing protein [Arthrobacter sp. MA-N2]|uniref:serine hydrolase domain-containing protein n=1 Tax=Arthrobacter sp. MA-N2 TaxID=1101188 RepID=UPI0004861084|nr:serine hydrolase domain-containing protein [Arthrobacter sp. MA-N2]